MKCKDCEYLSVKETISLLSQMMGYTAECSKAGTMFNHEKAAIPPFWCPLRNEKETIEKLVI